MKIILIPAITVLIGFIINSLRKDKQKPMYYVFVFFIIFFLELTFSYLGATEHTEKDNSQSYLYADNNLFRPNAQIEQDIFMFYFDEKKLSPEERAYYQAKIDKHLKDGNKCLEDAKKVSLLIPDKSDREMAKTLFISAAQMVAGGTPQSKAVMALLSLFVSYALDVYDQWAKIETLLHYARYNFEMAEFYKDVLANY